MFLSFITAHLAETLAVIVGIVLLRFLKKGYQTICIQMFVSFSIDVAGYILNKEGIPNIPIYNVYMLVDFGLLLYAANHFLNKKYLLGFAAIYFGFVVMCIYFGFKYSVFNFAAKSYVIECIVLIIIYLIILYRSAVFSRVSVFKTPLFWISIGIIVFYGTTVIYLSNFNGINNLSETQDKMLLIMLKLIAQIPPLCEAVAFLLFYLSER